MLRYLSAIPMSHFDINLLSLKRAPKRDDRRAEAFDAVIEIFVELVHLDKVVAVEVALLLVLLLMHVDPLYLLYLPEQVLFIDRVTRLVHLGQLELEEAAHLKDAQHLLLLELERVVVREQLDLEGVRELLDHLEVEQIEKLRQETLLSLIDVNLIHSLLLPSLELTLTIPLTLTLSPLLPLRALSSLIFPLVNE